MITESDDRGGVAERVAEQRLEECAIAGSPSAPIAIEAIVIPTWQAEM